ncbi:Toprim domain-containing protein [Phyllobacterium leguminum]|uniref:Toprim domain-containing protein n=1 Tax=Phyllobacterium leguminum TaxID=314237 RepID=A0A318TID5_9HYPH|nr:Toprim domain-containing protein [Phyllobacterium leguminum]
MLRCHSGCSFTDILDALKGRGLVEGEGNYSPPSPADLERIRQAENDEAKRKEGRALACWREARPIHGTIVETYLRHRGITSTLADTLRFHPDCWHPSGNRFPAMVALVEGAPRLAVHRTYLRPDGRGKAQIEPAKAMLGAVAGGAVRLSSGTDKLIVCEGIETGLSLLSGLVRGSVAVWAALSTSGMKALSLPDNPALLTIATDGDDAGREAGNARATRAALAGWKVSLLPAPDGRDWNDILLVKGAAA